MLNIRQQHRSSYFVGGPMVYENTGRTTVILEETLTCHFHWHLVIRLSLEM